MKLEWYHLTPKHSSIVSEDHYAPPGLVGVFTLLRASRGVVYVSQSNLGPSDVSAKWSSIYGNGSQYREDFTTVEEAKAWIEDLVFQDENDNLLNTKGLL